MVPGGWSFTCALLLQAAAAPARFDAATFDPLVQQGIERGAYPGAALIVGRGDTVLFAKGYGRLTWRASGPAVDPDSTVYDLASLTKVVATTTALMLLVERGQVALDDPVERYLAEFPGGGAVSVRQLLTHTSGLRATLLLHRDTRDADEALARVLREAPVAPGTRVVYSDLNAILLGELVHRVTGEPLDRYAAREVFARAGLHRTAFRPPARWRSQTAPTSVWRGSDVAGSVHDGNAARLGGVAGHAGVFASGADVARFAQIMLREGVLPGGGRLLRTSTVRLFTTRVPPPRAGEDARALGWQAVPTGETVSSAGTLFGPRSYGHTGYTGTSLWIDPDRDLFVVLLTNRAYAPRSRRSFTVLKEVRGRVADAAARASDGR
jgi:CubicO group peptidase (beta-lactamase class C family)